MERGAALEMKHTTMQPGISSVDVYHVINVPVPSAISHQFKDDRGETNERERDRFMNAKKGKDAE